MIIRIIIALNVAVYLAWVFASGPASYAFMLKNFTVSGVGLLEGRWWTLLTSAFSHSTFLHLLLNMYVLNGFGNALRDVLGRGHFVSFYLLAGVSGSFMHAVLSILFLNSPGLPALGASGAIAGIILYFSLSFPHEKLLLFGLVPIKARWAAVLIVVLDLWGLSAQSKGGGLPIGHGAHLGGALIGLVYYFFTRPKRELTPP